jgi:hypothetical protein
VRFHLFGPLKDALRGSHFAEYELKHNVHEELQRFSKQIYAIGIQRLRQRWKNVSIIKENLRKKELKFVKDLNIRNINFIIILNIFLRVM